MLICTSVVSYSKPVKAIFTFVNYTDVDLTVIIQVYDKKNTLIGNPSYTITKGTISPSTKTIDPFTSKTFELNCEKEGIIKIKYKVNGNGAEYTIDPLDVPKSNDNLVRVFDLSGFSNFDPNTDKTKFIELGHQLNLTESTEFTRLVDLIPQLGSLVVGKMVDKKLTNVDYIPITNVKYEFTPPSIIDESKFTQKSVMTDLSVTIPIYGSIASSMTNDAIYSVRYNVSYYPYNNSAQISPIINSWDSDKKKALLANLRLLDKGLYVYILRKFDVLEQATFSITDGTKIELAGSASIAAISTLSGSYIFNAQKSKSISIPSKGYNLIYDPWISVDDLITRLAAATKLPIDGADDKKFTEVDALLLKN